MNYKQIQAIIQDIKFPPWEILLVEEKPGIYLQISDPDAYCNRTGEARPWKGRKWRISYHMTESEIVKTALKAVLAALEHEALESFTYKGLTIFDPHIQVRDLIQLRLNSPLDARS